MEFPVRSEEREGGPVTDVWIDEMMRDDFNKMENMAKYCLNCKVSVVVKDNVWFCQMCGRKFVEESVGSRDMGTQTPPVWMTEGDVMPEAIVFSQCGTDGSTVCSLRSFKSTFSVWPTTKALGGPISNQITVCRVMISYWYKNLCLFAPWLDPKTAMLREMRDSRPDETDEGVGCCVDRLAVMPVMK